MPYSLLNMTPAQIRAIRQATGENTATFGARLERSGRTVEDWEQGRRNPDPLAAAILRRLEARTATKRSRKSLFS